jgi:hypothetical protein
MAKQTKIPALSYVSYNFVCFVFSSSLLSLRIRVKTAVNPNSDDANIAFQNDLKGEPHDLCETLSSMGNHTCSGSDWPVPDTVRTGSCLAPAWISETSSCGSADEE